MNGEARELFASADVVIVGPVAPLRGGIAQHTERLAEAIVASGRKVAVASFSRLYPASLFPGRSQRIEAAVPAWSHEVLDVLSPPGWLALGRTLEAGHATVVLQWWHPVLAPVYATATRRVAAGRLVAVCHNVAPHEPVIGARAAARRVLSRCGRVICHGAGEAGRTSGLLGEPGPSVVSVPLPCLMSEAALGSAATPRPLRAGPGSRTVVAAGHLRPYKGAALLAGAWLRAKRPPESQLLFVGESYLSGEDRRELEETIAGDPSIILMDQYVGDAELVQILASADAVVAAHLSASQSGVLPIATALGVPAIVSDAGDLASQSPAATVVPAGDGAALASAIEAVLSRPRRPPPTVAASASRRAEEWRRVVEAIVGAPRP